MEKFSLPNQQPGTSEEEKSKEREKYRRSTYAKNMIQMQLALRKGFDGTTEERNPEHYFEKYAQAFGDMVGEHPEIIENFYISDKNMDTQMEETEKLVEKYVTVSFKQ